MKEKIVHMVIEGVIYVLLMLILLLIADKCGWTTTPVLDNLLWLFFGWIICKIIVLFLYKKRK